MGFGRRGALVTSTALVALTVAGSAVLAASIKRSDPQSDEGPAAAITNEAQGNSVGGGLGGFHWSLSGQNAQPGQEAGQNVSLGYDNTSISIKGKWDSRYQARGGASFGATLDESRLRAIGGGFLTNQRASEFYGQYQFIDLDLDPLSAFTVGEHVSREEQFFATGGRQVWAYTTYLNWFKRNDGRQMIRDDAPAALRDGLQSIMNHFSAMSGTVAYTYAPMVNIDDYDGSPRTNALDLTLRGVTPSPFGQYFPVSAGIGANYAHYKHYDDATETQLVGNGGLGVAFLGGDYFSHPVSWLVGFGADGDTRGVVGGTVAAELGPLSVSYRQTSDQQIRILASWRVSDLFSDSDRQKASTLAVADGRAPLSFTPASTGTSELADRIARAEGGLRRLGFMPPTGNEVSRSADGSGAMRLSAASAAIVPDQVQTAIDRTLELKRKVQIKKQESEGGPKLIKAFINYDGANQIVPNGANDPVVIDLNSNFSGGGISYSINSQPSFITLSGSTLTINPAPANSGAAGPITVTATRNGKSTTASFNYDVQ